MSANHRLPIRRPMPIHRPIRKPTRAHCPAQRRVWRPRHAACRQRAAAEFADLVQLPHQWQTQPLVRRATVHPATAAVRGIRHGKTRPDDLPPPPLTFPVPTRRPGTRARPEQHRSQRPVECGAGRLHAPAGAVSRSRRSFPMCWTATRGRRRSKPSSTAIRWVRPPKDGHREKAGRISAGTSSTRRSRSKPCKWAPDQRRHARPQAIAQLRRR